MATVNYQGITFPTITTYHTEEFQFSRGGWEQGAVYTTAHEQQLATLALVLGLSNPEDRAEFFKEGRIILQRNMSAESLYDLVIRLAYDIVARREAKDDGTNP